MSVIETNINSSRLYDDLKKGGRSGFTYSGAKALMEYLQDQDEVHEYDPILFNSYWTEYADIEELAEAYSDTLPAREDFDNDEEHLVACLEDIHDITEIIAFSGFVAETFCTKAEPSYIVKNF